MGLELNHDHLSGAALSEALSNALDIPEFQTTAPVEPMDDPKPAAIQVPEDVSHPSEAADSQTEICLGLIGAHGGAGVTTLAVQTAMNLRARDPVRPICLVDLDFEAGAVSAYMDVTPMACAGDLTMHASRVDTQAVRALITEHDSGLHLFAVNPQLDGNRAVNPNTVLAVLDALADLYPTLVLDIPRLWTPWTQAALGAADRVAMVSELTVPGLHAARTRIREIEALLSNAGSPRTHAIDVVVNKFERRSMRNSLHLRDAQKAFAPLDRGVAGTVGIDPDTAREALNCGVPASAVKPDSRLCRDVASLCETLVPSLARTPGKRERRRRKRSR